MASTVQTGFQYGGENIVRGIRYDSSDHGAVFSGTHAEPAKTSGVRPRGIAYGGGTTPGFQWGEPDTAAWGGQYGGLSSPSVEYLIDTEGFALVLESPSGDERLGFTPDEPAYQSLKSLSWTTEVNAMASWSATVPANAELFNYPFSRVVIAYDGERRFHGVFLPVHESEFHDGEMQLGGFGPFWWGTHGEIQVSYSGTAAWRALQDVWLAAARETNGRVRGNVVRPRPEHVNDHWIPENGVEWSGTPVEVLQKAHGYAGMAWSLDHSEPGAVAQSFVPGNEFRETGWRPTSVKPSIHPEGYHNQVTVRGAAKPGLAELDVEPKDRFSATVSAPQSEIEQVADGLVIGRTEIEDELTSDDACRARANTLLAEDRGQYTVGGSLETTPGVRRLIPGYTYRVEQFDTAAPEIFTPVWCTLRSVEQSYGPGEATVSLSFEDESGIVQHIRRDVLPDMAPQTVKRRDMQQQQANPNYTSPDELMYGAGSGAAGSGHAGATDDGGAQ